MYRAIAKLIVLALGVAAELTPMAPFPGKDVFGSAGHCSPTVSVVCNKIYTFGGCYAIPYVVDPSDSDWNPFSFMLDKKYNTTNEIYSYDMETDQWAFEGTTPHPLKSATTQVVGDVVYFFNSEFETNDTRIIDMWSYHTVDKTWTQLARLPFVWRGHLKTCERDGQIFMTGSEDGRQINRIHAYDIASNAWEQQSIAVDKQFRIEALRCLDNRSFWLVGQVFTEETFHYAIYDGRTDARVMETARVYADGSVEMGALTFEYHMLDRAVVAEGVLYVLDRNGDEMFLSKMELGTHEKTAMATFESELKHVQMAVHGESVFLFGGFTYGSRPSKKGISKFQHKYTA